MSIFSPSNLGKWEQEYQLLLDGERHTLASESTWMLGDMAGLVAVFDGDEVVYIGSASKLAVTIRSFHKEGAVNEFRTFVAVFECGLSPKTAEKRYANGRAAKRVDTAISRMTFSVAAAPARYLDTLVRAFAAVADPRYNGPTALANLAIDALPK